MDIKDKNILIVGAGISGIVAANLLSKQNKITIKEQRDNIGGNCFDFVDENNQLVHKYGAHLFHTNNDLVWSYISSFGEWHKYEHQVLSKIDNEYYNMPINLLTINKFFNTEFTTKDEVEKYLKSISVKIETPQNAEEYLLSTIGKRLYETFFKGYTIKQWNKDPKQLPVDIVRRIPIYFDTDKRYFKDTYQFMPSKGFTELFNIMLDNSNINIQLNSTFKQSDLNKYDLVIFTGKIDEFFNYTLGELEYRSVRFEYNYIDETLMQPTCVVNYPGIDTDYTRILELKHATKIDSKGTLLIKEYPSPTGFPAYVINDEKNNSLLLKYKELALNKPGVLFAGRLGSYKYINMDEAILNMIKLVGRL